MKHNLNKYVGVPQWASQGPLLGIRGVLFSAGGILSPETMADVLSVCARA